MSGRDGPPGTQQSTGAGASILNAGASLLPVAVRPTLFSLLSLSLSLSSSLLRGFFYSMTAPF
jgi:hypothetical protein